MTSGTTYFSKKITFLNVVSMIMIVLLHAKPQERFGLPLDSSEPFIYMMWVLTQVAVPMFFFISAVLFYRNCTFSLIPQKLKSRIWSLLVPYLLWNILFVAVFWAMTHIPAVHGRMKMGDVLNSPREIILAVLTSRYTVLWFVKDLMILSLLSPAILLLLKNKWVSIIALAGMVVVPILVKGIGYEHTLNWLPIYFTGAMVGSSFTYTREESGRINVPDLLDKGLWRQTIAEVAAVTLVGTYAIALKGEEFFYPFRLLAPVCVWFMTDIAASGFIGEKFTVRKWMSYTFVIFCIHQFLLNVVEKVVVLNLPPTSLVLNVTYIAAPVIVIFISIGFCAVFSRCRIYKYFSGGR